jgi:hypothetical protein
VILYRGAGFIVGAVALLHLIALLLGHGHDEYLKRIERGGEDLSLDGIPLLESNDPGTGSDEKHKAEEKNGD